MKREFGRLLLFSILISLAISIIPVALGIDDPFIINCLYVIVDLLLLLYLGNVLIKAGCFDRGKQKPNWKNLFILAPSIIFLLAYPVIFLFNGYPMLFGLGHFNETVAVYYIQIIVSSIYDELLFRLVLQQGWFGNKSKIARVLLSALVFALFQVLSSGIYFDLSIESIVFILIYFVVSYAFGFIMGFLMECTRSIYVCVILHIVLAVFCNYEAAVLLVALLLSAIAGGYLTTGNLLVFASIFEILSPIYMVIMYNAYFKKQEF